MRYTFYFLFIATVLNQAQSQGYIPYEWDQERTFSELDQKEASYPLYYLLKVEKRQFVYEEGSGGLVCFVTSHQIIRANNAEALEKVNRIYVPLYNTLEVVDIKARVLTEKGKIIYSDNRNIKELEEEEAGYKIFAIEGAEVGSEIEFYFTRKVSATSFFRVYFQEEYPLKRFNFSLLCPENLEYEFEVYNQNTQVTQTDTSKTYNSYSFETQNIGALIEEDFSAFENNKRRIEGRLAYNSASGKGRLFTWGEAGKRIHGQITELNKFEVKAFEQFVKKLDLSGNPIDAFCKAEHFIKTNFIFDEHSGDQGENLDLVLQNRYATSKGFTKLYVAILKKLNIQYELVLVCDRMKVAFDPEFDSWNYLDEYVIHIIDVDKYLSPKDISFRLGTIPYGYVGSYALFIREKPIQHFQFPVARIGVIPSPPYSENYDNMEIKVSFSDDLEKNRVDLIRHYKGYASEYYKTSSLIFDTNRMQELLDDVVMYLAEDAEIEKSSILEGNADWKTWSKPFSVEAVFTTTQYLETAGDAILFNVGSLIGPQSELYQERERQTPIVNTFNRGYFRKIAIKIPEGYRIQNPDDLIIVEKVYEKERLIFNFESKYTLMDNELSIEIDEFYDELYYPVEKFEAFRKVINAAADWNKIVLVLKPES